MSANTSAQGYQAVVADVVRRIAGGELPAGERLPTVRAAAARWGVNANTVARAYAELAARGLVAGRAGGGTRVTGGAVLNPSLDAMLDAAIAGALAAGLTSATIEAHFAARLAHWQAMRLAPATVGSATVRVSGSH